ncbi:androgen-dependent TFPI-regulating protein [Nothobranchius furzeri]|uniref:Transcript variant X1 n=4 Tax=Nothobranchius furzeri TaxID=105023 RepID=A0A9D2YFL7_NOTFU|nr:androgen-dependent TFPI-regulating protein [Nothobranchius furzeri]KAF7219606.1 transcript variant X1 [Nothobranchius furzeri]
MSLCLRYVKHRKELILNRIIFKEPHNPKPEGILGVHVEHFPFLLRDLALRMTTTPRTAFHMSAFCWYAFVVQYLAAKDGEELPKGIFVYGGPWKYLTFLNLLLQMTFFGLATVADLQLGKETESSLSRWKDRLFAVFAFPVGTFVVLLFWMIFAYDRELVYPATIDAFFPPWTNHAMHTFVLPVLLGEVLVQPHTFPQTQHALAALGVVGLAYLSWIVWVYLSVGIWVYPLLRYFSPAGLLGFFCFNMSVVSLLYQLGDQLNSYVWSQTQSFACLKQFKDFIK